jgi:hypothetical protein
VSGSERRFRPGWLSAATAINHFLAGQHQQDLPQIVPIIESWKSILSRSVAQACKDINDDVIGIAISDTKSADPFPSSNANSLDRSVPE